MAISLLTSYGCGQGTGFYRLDEVSGGSEPHSYSLVRTSDGQELQADTFTLDQLPLEFGLYDGQYSLRVRGASGGLGTDSVSLSCKNPDPGSGTPTVPTQPGALMLDSVSRTNETAAGHDGTATIQASGGLAPLTAELVELSLSRPATAGQPSTFGPLPASIYTLRVTDSAMPPATVQGQVTIAAYVAPVTGCQDEYADNYDPLATADTQPPSCTYSPRWRSAWGPARMAVRVPAPAGQVLAYLAADLRIGFRPGHPAAELRPLSVPLRLRATIGPDGYATFCLAPYVQRALGADDGAGGYRLDLNSATAYGSDLYVGYELRSTAGELLEHGYALNAAVPDFIEPLTVHAPLSPFRELPLWPGFDYLVSYLSSIAGRGQYALVESDSAEEFSATVRLPCPANPLPVAWLAPGGGYGYWVFSGKPQLGDDVGEGQLYREPATGQRRYSDAGKAYQTYKASSGVFKGDALLTGLRTLWRSPQAWAQLVPGGEWVSIVVERGQRDVGLMGVLRNEVALSFSTAAAEYAQGQ